MTNSVERRARGPRVVAVAVAAVLVLSLTGGGALALRAAQGGQEIVIGAIAPGEGPFAAAGLDAFRGLDLAETAFGGTIGGKKVVVIKVGTDGSPESAVAAATRLVEEDGADLIIGPLTAEEGLAIKEYARTVPGTTFLIGGSGAQEVTPRNPVGNVFRFTPDHAQWQSGLGTFARYDLGYLRVAIVASNSLTASGQVHGFMSEFCTNGGHIPSTKVLVPEGTTDFAAIVPLIPTDVDAIYVALNGDDALAFLTAYDAAGGQAPILAGTTTLDVLLANPVGPIRDRLVGVASAGPVAAAATDPAWAHFVADYRAAYPDGQPTPSRYASFYYTATEAAMLALQ